MADTIYTRALARAAEAEGSVQALAHLLRVPENTLVRWMSGRAQMPLQAFLRLLEQLVKYEKSNAVVANLPAAGNGEPLGFNMGELKARCARCDGTHFTQAAPDEPLQLTSTLVCRACGEAVVHHNLIAQLAKDAVYQSRAMTAARTRRQAELLKKSPKLRALKEAAEGPKTRHVEDPKS